MSNRIAEKTVLITGATAGIGRATARLFAESGCLLILTGRRTDRLDALREEIESGHGVDVQTASFDIRDRQACTRFVKDITKPVDILVNNAGLARGTDAVYEANFEDWETMIDTNIKGLLYLTRLIAPSMKEHKSGHIINLSSTAGHDAYPGGSVYCGTKHAVKAITEATKKDLHGTNVRVSMVSPGLVETEFSMVRFEGDKDKADQVYEGIHPLKAEDIAEIIVFVANRPAHVNIMDTVVYTTNQSSATMVYRDHD